MKIEKIIVPEPNELIFYFYDGRVIPKHWESTARVDCYAPERLLLQ